MRIRPTVAWPARLAICFVSLIPLWIAAPDVQAANSQLYADSTGDVTVAADIGNLTVSNDDAGLVTIVVQLANRPALGDEAINVYLDTDQNPSTGGTGMEYRVRYHGTDPQQYALDQWNGTVFAAVPAASFSGNFSPATRELVFRVNRSDLAGTLAFNFYAATHKPGTSESDVLPDGSGGRLTYQVLLRATNTARPSIAGDPRVDQVLTASPGTWTGQGPISHGYQWQRCNAQGEACQAIAAATEATYRVTSADIGSTLRVIVTATNPGGTASALSDPTAVVPNPDTDADRVPDATDLCPTVPGGPFDYNGNGCPGIFPAIAPDFRPLVAVSGRRPIRFVRFRIADLSPAASVTIQSRSLRERLTANSGGKVESRRFRNKSFRIGTLFTVKITKAGFIGYWARLRLYNRSPFLRPLVRRCTPAVGAPIPTRCRAVDRGK